jgi:hypothetical protein
LVDLKTRSRIVEGVVITIVGGVVLAIVLWLGPAAIRAMRGPQANLLTIAVHTETLCPNYWVPDGDPSTVPLPGNQPTAEEDWVRRTHAVNIGQVIVVVDVQGATEKSVWLDQFNVVVDSRDRSVPHGNSFDLSGGCGGEPSPRHFALDLAANKPEVVPVEGMGDSGRVDPPRGMPLSVTSSDAEQLRVEAELENVDNVRWHLEIAWHSGLEKGIAKVDSGYGPFHTLGWKAVQAAGGQGCQPGSGQWYCQ